MQARDYRPAVIVRVRERPPDITLSITDQIHIIGPSPRPGLVFIPGYYYWNAGTYVWIDPIWTPPPLVGAVWIQPNWMFDWPNGEWTMQEGYWENPPDNPPLPNDAVDHILDQQGYPAVPTQTPDSAIDFYAWIQQHPDRANLALDALYTLFNSAQDTLPGPQWSSYEDLVNILAATLGR